MSAVTGASVKLQRTIDECAFCAPSIAIRYSAALEHEMPDSSPNPYAPPDSEDSRRRESQSSETTSGPDFFWPIFNTGVILAAITVIGVFWLL